MQDQLPEKAWIYRRQLDGPFSYDPREVVDPAAPFMGTIGTAPELEALSSLTPFTTAATWAAARRRTGLPA